MKKLLILLCAIAAMSTAAYAQKPFLDTSRPEKFISFGLRAGLNSSGLDNNYLSAQPEMIQNNFYWRTGGQLGGSVDLYLRQFLSIQTGFFWETNMTISGRWAIPVHAGRAVKSMWTSAATKRGRLFPDGNS